MKRYLQLALAVLGGVIIGSSFASCGRRSDVVQVDDDLTFTFVSGEKRSPNRLLEVQVDGPILNSSSSGLGGLSMGATYGYDVQRLLEKASKDKRVKGIFLRLATPGGTIVGSNAIFEGLVNYRKTTNKPVVAYIEGLSASGGVMSMVGADKIYAAPGSLIGSIGVIGGILTYFDNPVALDGGLLGGGIVTKNGIQQTVISAGRGKDLGNPFRKPTEEELQVLRQGVNYEYNQFVQLVSKTRGISEQTIRSEMGALVFDNQTAQKYKLIDGTRSRSDAIATLAKQANVGTNYQLVRTGRKGGLLSALLSSAEPALTPEQSRDRVSRDLCWVTASRAALVYYGDVSALCPKHP